MKKILFEADFSKGKASDDDIKLLLNLNSSVPYLSKRSEDAQIALNRSILKTMLIAEELGGTFTVVNNDGNLSFSVSNIL